MPHCQCTKPEKASWIGAFFICALLYCHTASAKQVSACAADHIDEWARVARIYDGDTLRLQGGRVIRFIGINAPELAHDGRAVQPVAEAARQAVADLLPVGSRVGLRFDAQHYGPHRRVLAHVFDSRGRNVSAILLRQGEAFAIAIPPNLWRSSCYFLQEHIAREQKRGIWGLSYYRPRQAGSWQSREGGFYRVRGRIDHIGQSRRNLWLDMGQHMAVRISRKNLPYFVGLSLRHWLGKTITVRGWARYYDGKLNLTLTHPAMIEKLP